MKGHERLPKALAVLGWFLPSLQPWCLSGWVRLHGGTLPLLPLPLLCQGDCHSSVSCGGSWLGCAKYSGVEFSSSMTHGEPTGAV